MSLPDRKTAADLLHEHVKDEYQLLHSKMVATVLEAYADKFSGDKDLWYITGLLHDIDYYEFPDTHPKVSVGWFKEWEYPEELIHAVEAHGMQEPRVEPKSELAACLIAVDELTGLLYAYSLMRPEGFVGMSAKSAKKKFKDKAFAAKVDREEINYGMEKLGVEFGDHVNFVIEQLQKMV